MKIAIHGPDLLVLTDLSAPIRMVGAVFLLVGSGFGFGAVRTPPIAVSYYLIATLLIVLGLAMVILPERVTAAFDRTRHTLVITRRSVRGSTQDEVDFSKITAVVAESSTGASDDQQMFRVTVVLRDGARLPLTSYYSNSPTHFTAATAANDFLGLPTPPAIAPSAVNPTAVAMRRPPSALALGCMTVFCLVFAGFGVRLLWQESRRLDTSLPISAAVLSTSVETIRGTGRNSGPSYKPIVVFRYEIGNREYTAHSVTPLNESRGGQWAYKIVARYHPGDTITAWYDPTHPDQAFLLHEWSILPLVFIAFPLVFLVLVAWMAIVARRNAKARQAS